MTIVAIEFQKTWTDRGLFHRLIRRELRRRNVHANTVQLLRWARSNGVPVVHAPLIIDPQDRVAFAQMPRLARVTRQFRAGSIGSEYSDGVFEPCDIEVTGRIAFDATIGSDLLAVLAGLSPAEVFVVGFTTEHCVAETIDALITNGYLCTLVSDCTATKSDRLQRSAEAKFQTITADEMTSRPVGRGANE